MSPSTPIDAAAGAPVPRSEAFDRAAQLRTRETELEALRSDCLLLPLWRSKSLIARSEPPRPVLFEGSDAAILLAQATELVFLGLQNGRALLAADLPPAGDTRRQAVFEDRGDFSDLRMVGGQLGPDDVALLAYARGMLSWHRRQQHCGKCGAATRSCEGGHLRECGDCGERHFPRTDPAIMALVLHDDRCLLARQPGFPPGMYSVLAGFVEPGETLEAAVIREVHEEAGIEVGAPRYVRSQPWPFPSSLMLGFVAHARADVIVLDGEELEDARWLGRAELREPDGFFVPPRFSLSGQLIAMFVDGELD